MNISDEILSKVTRLSGLEDENSELRESIKRIVSFAEKISTFDANVNDISISSARLREDTAGESLQREKLLQNAPHASGGCFVVRKILE